MRVLAAVALLLATIPTFAIQFGPERPVTGAVYGLAPELRIRPRVAMNESGGLVLWSDMRNHFLAVYIARLDRDGKLLDPVGRKIAVQGDAMDVIWTGSAWLVAYRDHEAPGLVVRTIDLDGNAGPAIRVLPLADIGYDTVRMATNGSSVALVTNAGNGALLGLDGSVRATFTFPMQRQDNDYAVDVAAAGDAYGFVSVSAEGVSFRRLSAAGAVSAPQLLPGSDYALTAALGSDGSSFLAVYDAPPNLMTQKLDALGTPVGAAQRVATLPVRLVPLFPSIAWGGSQYLVSMVQIDSNDRSEPLAMLVTRDGAAASAPVRSMNTMRTFYGRTDVARRGDGSGVAVSVSIDRVLEAAFFDAGTAVPRVVRPLSFSLPSQRELRMAGEGDTLVSAWVQSTALGDEVLLAHGVGGVSIVAASAAQAELRDVAVDGAVTWVVWTESDGRSPPRLLARRFDASLQPMGEPAVLRTSAGPEPLQAAAGGGALLATWASSYSTLAARVVRPDGTVVAIPNPTTFNAPYATAAWNGREFVLVWSEATEPVFYEVPKVVPYVLRAMRIGTDGVVRDAAPLVVSDVPRTVQYSLRAASSHGAILIGWQEAGIDPGYTGYDYSFGVTKLARFDGTERPAARVLDEKSQRGLRAIVPLGERVALLWSGAGLEYAIVSRDFAVEEKGSIAVYADSADMAARGGQPVIGYSRQVEEPELGGVYRVYLRASSSPVRRRPTR